MRSELVTGQQEPVVIAEAKVRELMFRLGMALLEEHREVKLPEKMPEIMEQTAKQWSELHGAMAELKVLDQLQIRERANGNGRPTETQRGPRALVVKQPEYDPAART
jgi:hypothetical protein